MSNHLHFISVPPSEDSPGKVFKFSSAKIRCGISQDDPWGVNQLFDYIEK